MPRPKTYYYVIVDIPQTQGGMTDRIFRFRKQSDAESFAVGKTYMGQPATAREDQAPARLLARWGV